MPSFYLKSKEPRLRDWNMKIVSAAMAVVVSWNQKNLDYEIETEVIAVAFVVIFVALEIKRTSITRLKQFTCRPPVFRERYLKSKEPRLRDWNWNNPVVHRSIHFLKSKEPRLRDWNRNCGTGNSEGNVTWNQKNLDYEIETNFIGVRLKFSCTLEIKRTSITRLKLWRSHSRIHRITCLEIKRTSITRLKPQRYRRFRCSDRVISWNQKNLDYEIETAMPVERPFIEHVLEIKRTSITRLKRCGCAIFGWRNSPWNQKNLDYEIETPDSLGSATLSTAAWNQKNLDYEIETHGKR